MSRSIYEEITRQIIELLKRDHVPWIRGWEAWPLRHNGQLFTGTNSLILCLAADEAGYRSRYWLTKAQGKRLGAKIPDGQAGTRVLRPVIAPLPSAVMDPRLGLVQPGTRRVWKTREGERLRVRMDSYRVFNAEQFVGLPDRYYAAPEPDARPLEAAHHFFEAIDARMEEGGNSASYSPTEDLIRMPRSAWFRGGTEYFATLAHELGHWTGHGKRLARSLVGQFGDPEYAKEELVAELAAAYVLAANDLPGIRRQSHAAYLSSWLEILENDPEAFPRAATLGQSAADYLTISAAAPCVEELEARSLDGRDYHVIYFDRVEVGPNPMLVAIGLDTVGLKFLLGVRPAAAKEEDGIEAAQALLRSLVDRGLPPNEPRLFVTSDVATLRKALQADFARPSLIQRCRATVVREVVSQLTREDRTDGTCGDAGRPDGEGSTQLTRATVRDRIRDAYDLGTIAGVFPLNRLAHQLEGEGAAESAETLRASLNGLFTVARLGLEPPLSRTLSTTHMITQARFALPRQICRPPTWEDERMALQWSITSFWKTVEGRRRIAGFSQLRGLVARMAERARRYPWPSTSPKQGS